MSKGLKYKNDFEGGYLCHKRHTKNNNKVDMNKVYEYKVVSDRMAAKNFRYNPNLFNKIGMTEDDVKSIGLSYVYLFFKNYNSFSKKSEEKAILSRFLRQRFMLLITMSKRKSTGILESVAISGLYGSDDEFSEESIVDALINHNDNPEELYVAKVTKESFSDTVDLLCSIANTYARKSYKNHTKTLEHFGVTQDDYLIIAKYFVLRFLQNNPNFSTDVDGKKFTSFIIQKLSKFANAFKASVGKKSVKLHDKYGNKIREMKATVKSAETFLLENI